ncbi:hypothetical protein SAE02_05970 [Skermanella aerolata]|uniref:Uncharacterized protein n=1 Tax=Skermanella aerolata TaxID=393310 RepID=A0A512DIZ2_9PROT|nr:hypothetical protein SAE02_05970 [Skermanella aerolata]
MNSEAISVDTHRVNASTAPQPLAALPPRGSGVVLSMVSELALPVMLILLDADCITTPAVMG